MDEAAQPMLLLTAPQETLPFDGYLDEALRSEGWCLHEHLRAEAGVTAADLAGHTVVVISAGAARVLDPEVVKNYVRGGGRALAVRPPRHWAPLFGLVARTAETYATLRDGYLRVREEHAWLRDFPAVDLQCPGEADVYEPGVGQPLAWLAGQRGEPTAFPAAACERIGAGVAVMLAWDLAEVLVALHQGDPARASTGADPDANRDGKFTADDLFEGRRDFGLRHAPQADAYGDLLTRVLHGLTADELPLPRLWHFPDAAPGLLLVDGDGDSMNRDDLRATVETCERHDARFGFFLMDEQLATFEPQEIGELRARGHSFGPHPWISFRPSVGDWRAGVERITAEFGARFGFAPTSVRMHSCILPGWDEAPRLLADLGLRLETSFLEGYRHQSGFLNGSALPVRFVDREGRVLDCWEQSTVLGDDTMVTTKTMLPPRSEEQCIELSLQLMRELAGRWHGVFHPYFHPINVGGRGRINTVRWLECVLSEAGRLGMPAPSPDGWLRFTQARRATRIHGLRWDPAARELHFSLLSGEAIQGLTLLLPHYAGRRPERAAAEGNALDLGPVEHEGLGWSMLVLDLAAGARTTVCVGYPDS